MLGQLYPVHTTDTIAMKLQFRRVGVGGVNLVLGYLYCSDLFAPNITQVIYTVHKLKLFSVIITF